MPANLTPQPASSSFVYSEAFDTPEQRFDQLTPATTTAAVNLGVISTALYAGTIPYILKTTYSPSNIVTTTFNSNLASQYTISKVVYSMPIVLKNVTAYQQITPVNTTVWNTYGTPSSLLMTPGQSDVVSYSVAVVADSVL